MGRHENRGHRYLHEARASRGVPRRQRIPQELEGRPPVHVREHPHSKLHARPRWWSVRRHQVLTVRIIGYGLGGRVPLRVHGRQAARADQVRIRHHRDRQTVLRR